LSSRSNTLQHNSFSFTPRTKYILDIYNTAAIYHRQQQRSNRNYHPISPNVSRQDRSTSSRLQSVPTLPPLNSAKQQNHELSNASIQNEQEYKLLNTNKEQISNDQPIIDELITKF